MGPSRFGIVSGRKGTAEAVLLSRLRIVLKSAKKPWNLSATSSGRSTEMGFEHAIWGGPRKLSGYRRWHLRCLIANVASLFCHLSDAEFLAQPSPLPLPRNPRPMPLPARLLVDPLRLSPRPVCPPTPT